MKKITIFTEGQTEQIFLRYFLAIIFGWDKISFSFLKLYGGGVLPSLWDHKPENAEIHFQIINVCGDENVLSVIKEREERLFQEGYENIIGLRDLYSEAYLNRTNSTIDDVVTEKFINAPKDTILEMSKPDRIKMYFAIMEIEAWFLGMYNIFQRIDSQLQIEFIKEELDFDLHVIDPQKEFLRPHVIIHNILLLAGKRYKKSKGEVESICSIMEKDDIDDAFKNGRCSCFKELYIDMDEIEINSSPLT